MEIIIPAGYQITAVSWENDADNYQTNVVNGLSESMLLFYIDVITTVGCSEYSNMWEPDEAEVTDYYAALCRLWEKHYDNMVKESSRMPKNWTYIIHAENDKRRAYSISDLVVKKLLGSTEYFTRVLEGYKVVFFSNDVYGQPIAQSSIEHKLKTFNTNT